MAKYEVRDVVCDYGLFENNELVLVCNSRRNALLIKAIMEKDSVLNGNQSGNYLFTDADYISFMKDVMKRENVTVN